MPVLKMMGGKDKAIDKFRELVRVDKRNLLLIDLDESEPSTNFLRAKNLDKIESHIYFMIQELEAWFISQPAVLDTFYGNARNSTLPSKRLTNRKASEIPDPKEELKKATKGHAKGTYDEIRHGTRLLPMLDTEKLKKEFPDVDKLFLKLAENCS